MSGKNPQGFKEASEHARDGARASSLKAGRASGLEGLKFSWGKKAAVAAVPKPTRWATADTGSFKDSFWGCYNGSFMGRRVSGFEEWRFVKGLALREGPPYAGRLTVRGCRHFGGAWVNGILASS